MTYAELKKAIEVNGYRSEENELRDWGKYGVDFEVGFCKKCVWYWFTGTLEVGEQSKDSSFMSFRESYNTNTGRRISRYNGAFKYGWDVEFQLLKSIGK